MNQVVAGSHMNQEKPKNKPQVFYNDRWVDKDHFRAYVYKENEQRLAKSYKEYEDLIASGLWFNTKAQAIKVKKIPLQVVVAEDFSEPVVVELKKVKARKPKHGADS